MCVNPLVLSPRAVQHNAHLRNKLHMCWISFGCLLALVLRTTCVNTTRSDNVELASDTLRRSMLDALDINGTKSSDMGPILCADRTDIWQNWLDYRVDGSRQKSEGYLAQINFWIDPIFFFFFQISIPQFYLQIIRLQHIFQVPKY